MWLAIALAGYRLAHLIVLDDGPGNVSAWIRAWFDARDGWIADFGTGVTTCMSCASFWTTLAAWGLWAVGLHELVWALAAWGVATLAHRATR
jgi:hypothetical protein